jgi:chromosome segregation ATPase
MNRVKEEFLLSVIFVGKWILLGVGILGLLYAAIYLAYHKSYFDPRIEAFNIEISELKDQKTVVEIKKKSLDASLVDLQHKIESIDLPKARKHSAKAKANLDTFGVSISDKVQFWKQGSEAEEKAKLEYNEAIEQQSKLEDELQKMLNDSERLNAEILKKKEEIGDISAAVAKKEKERNKVGTGVLGVIPWVAGILGLT